MTSRAMGFQEAPTGAGMIGVKANPGARDCAALGCDRVGRRIDRKNSGLKFCETHFKRVMKHGHPQSDIPIRMGRPTINKGKICSAEGCDRPVTARGLCMRHWQQDRRSRLRVAYEADNKGRRAEEGTGDWAPKRA